MNRRITMQLRQAIAPLVFLFAVEAVAAPPSDDSGDPEAEQFRRPANHQIVESTAPTTDTVSLGEVLALSEVLDAVQSHDPRLKAARYQVDHADGQLLSSRSGFDTVASFENIAQPPYRSQLTRVRLDQATALYGLTAWVGYQIGTAGPRLVPTTCTAPLSFDFSGCGRPVNSTGGEIFTGFTLPLLRGGWTDRRRTDIEQSKLERERMSHARDATQLMLELEAAEAYWHWVAAGLNMKIEQQLLDLAVTRNAKLLRQIELGSVDRLAGLENERVILDREARLVLAERKVQGAALELSLFLRDANGDPVVVGPERLPNDVPAMPPPADYDLDSDIESALAQRPDLDVQQRSFEQSAVEVRWAKNQRVPRLDFSAQLNHEFGQNPNLDPGEAVPLRTNMFTWVNLEVPIPMRFGRGQIRSAESMRRIIGADIQLLENQIAVEVTDAHIAVEAAYQQALLAGAQVGLTKELAQAELQRFELGDGDLLLVNLRELAIADAASGEVWAVTDYFIAKATLEVAKGEGVQNVEP
jgi:cobalt-zinc-cadmium efflux system outer membrane protein